MRAAQPAPRNFVSRSGVGAPATGYRAIRGGPPGKGAHLCRVYVERAASSSPRSRPPAWRALRPHGQKAPQAKPANSQPRSRNRAATARTACRSPKRKPRSPANRRLSTSSRCRTASSSTGTASRPRRTSTSASSPNSATRRSTTRAACSTCRARPGRSPRPSTAAPTATETTEYIVNPTPRRRLKKCSTTPAEHRARCSAPTRSCSPTDACSRPAAPTTTASPTCPRPTSGWPSSKGCATRASTTPPATHGPQSGQMNYGRWYPSLVTLANGNVFVASGVTKLVKPVYPERPLDSRHERPRDRDLRRGERHVDRERRKREPLAAAVPAPAPAPRRQGLLRRRRPGLQPVRRGLRRGDLDARRCVRPGDAERGRASGSRSASRPTRPQHLADARLPRLVLLDHAAAEAALHQGPVPVGRRRAGTDAGELPAHERERDQLRRNGARRRVLLDGDRSARRSRAGSRPR